MIVPVILSGGSGTRLWPLSRQNYPKQFLKITGTHSLLQQTLLRVRDIPHTSRAIIVCNEAHYFISQEQAQEIACSANDFILEPVARNTAPAIAVACLQAQASTHSDPFMLVLPADHHFSNPSEFVRVIRDAVQYADNHMILFGIPPHEAKTGYGYIKATAAESSTIHTITHFVEKPSLSKAQEYLADGHYYWNSGMFLLRASVYLDELKKYASDIYEAAARSYQLATKNAHYIRLHPESFASCRSESIDYAVLEQSDRCKLVPLDAGWADLGCWSSVHAANQADENNNVIVGSVKQQDARNCLLHSEDRLLAIMGLQDCIVINTRDTVLVAHQSYAEKLKNMVNDLRVSHQHQLLEHPKVHRPWGHYETLAEGKGFKVKQIVVKAQQQLSLQSHQHRAEHWIVVAGQATVTCDQQEFLVRVNQSTYIPKGSKHRLANNHPEELHVIEIQSGDYLGEDDIVRYEDVYGRVTAI